MNLHPSEKLLNGQEICEIIKVCGESGAVEFSYGRLHISFQARKDVWNDNAQTQSPGPVTAIPNVMDETDLIRPDEMQVKDDEIANLHIEDPLQYETLLAQRELENTEDD